MVPVISNARSTSASTVSPDTSGYNNYNASAAVNYAELWVVHLYGDSDSPTGGYCGGAGISPTCTDWVDGDGDTYDAYYNTNYRDYNFNGGDCANFVSQALYAGNFPMNSTWGYTPSGTKDQYDFDQGTGTYDWINAYGLKEYLLSIQGYDVSPSAAAEGDLVYDTAGGASHDEIITGFATNGDVLITCHNADAYQYPLTGYNGGSYNYSEIVQPVDWVAY